MYDIIAIKNTKNLSWIDKLDKSNIRINLYDKYRNSNSHTFLTYIIENYNNLRDYILFIPDINLNYENILEYFNYPNIFNREKYNKNLNFEKWLIENVDKDFSFFYNNYGYYTNLNLVFCVKKINILSRQKEYYIYLLKQLLDTDLDIEYFLEKSWYYIFNIHKDNIINNPSIIIVGSGLSGSVIAERLSYHDENILIIEKRDHIGGNCYDYIDNETGIRISKYGAHIFHTNNEEVWEYVNKYSEWKPYIHKVYGKISEHIFPIPINIKTVNILCNQNIKTSDEMINYLESVRDKTIIEPNNSEEYCLSKFGRELYEKVIKNYTKKQWNKYPNELDVSVLKRIPIRYDLTEGYFNDKYQALPINGYTYFINNIISKKNICIIYNTDYIEFKDNLDMNNIKKVFYTGPIDHYYGNLGMEKLEYRSINFKFEKIQNIKYFQENSVINYTSFNEEYTRIVEYKHFYDNNSDHTIISKEITTDIGEPYYPIPNDKNKNLYEKYKDFSLKENNIIFLGRLASYKYFNMDEAILNSLKIYKELYNNYEKKNI